ncbi:enoyl-CoA hydratase/isomerase family protein [Nonomuraea turcica]|uniref:enoyl-CoA hydratase/isomerase family protein n=1 Tax=Nonomuraea sp. G32 TaxID=3067274 RepID=UPI00273CB932|nr:enoyl-CoA hydratase/isomerase family protein [Nonomuraea sp. G32]MDP4505330.1 enoyl-CoA hydratase/isomerase family protein [Nonomuraea sp. G32]
MMRFERTGQVLTVFLPDPAASPGQDAAIHEALGTLFHDLRAEREARAIVLTGSGPDFFTGLNDVVGSLLWQRQAGLAVIDAGYQVARQLIWDLLDVEVPIIAALNGDAASIGATIALFCDAVFIADTASIHDAHVPLGIAVGDGGQVIWPLALGPTLAKRYLLTGDAVTAHEAERLGMVTHVCPADTVLAEARLWRRAGLAHRVVYGCAPPPGLRRAQAASATRRQRNSYQLHELLCM